ncbi:hypothetical protein PanWU01x14_256990 [Parasponia andersonii]|uniref:Uncharacterized protein n=1 Tax=Parasponia andersonii TaxID=3476 RepID=A0A2P5BAA0_PARAD|nr:hypothetical protein PanWU01x14_256990 [Parasponia andersonii]
MLNVHEAADVLLKQLEEIRAEEEELKRKKKQEKAKTESCAAGKHDSKIKIAEDTV